MRLTWIRTFFWFGVLGVVLSVVAGWAGGVSFGGVVGVIILALMLAMAVFSSYITPKLVQAYDPIPGEEYSERARRVTAIAWGMFIDGVRQEPLGAEMVKLMKQPPVKLADNPGPNAFCTGWNWHHSVVVVFKSLFVAFDWANEKYYGLPPALAKQRTDRQVIGVLMHEFGHYFHRDVAISAAAGVLNMLIAWTAAGLIRMLLSAFIDRVPVARNILLFILEQIITRGTNALLRLPQAAISRQRETAADIISAEFTGDPCLLASGLGNLEAYIKDVLLPKEKAQRQALQAKDKAAYYRHAILHAAEHSVMDALGICLFVHPTNLAAAAGKEPSWWDRLTADHPATKDRIAMAERFNHGSCKLATPVLKAVNS
jgi:Zn-dependent protease with chaperone function